jgi:hypothetical protein
MKNVVPEMNVSDTGRPRRGGPGVTCERAQGRERIAVLANREPG